MKNAFIKTLASFAAAAAVSTVAMADPISGGITFANSTSTGVTLTQLAPTTYSAAFSGASTTGGAGTFSAVSNGTSVSVATITLNGVDPLFGSADLPGPTDNNGNLWSFSSGSVDYWFDATSINVTAALSGWVLSGNGIFSDDGGDASNNGTYDLTFDAQGDLTSFSSATFADVPDAGTTALLVGLGLLGLGIYARRNKLARA